MAINWNGCVCRVLWQLVDKRKGGQTLSPEDLAEIVRLQLELEALPLPSDIIEQVHKEAQALLRTADECDQKLKTLRESPPA